MDEMEITDEHRRQSAQWAAEDAANEAAGLRTAVMRFFGKPAEVELLMMLAGYEPEYIARRIAAPDTHDEATGFIGIN